MTTHGNTVIGGGAYAPPLLIAPWHVTSKPGTQAGSKPGSTQAGSLEPSSPGSVV